MQDGFSQSRKLVKTSTPGIYKRGSRYVVRFRDAAGRQHKRSARTMAEARDLKAALTADVKRGEYRALSRVTFAEYAAEWIETYTGRTSRGIRVETLAGYRDHIEREALPFFGRMQLTAIEPRDVKRYAATLAERGLSPSSVRRALAPIRALLATAFEDGVIRSNPAAGLRIAQRIEDVGGDEKVKALGEPELRALLGELPDEWRLFFELLAHTGLRIGEAVALTWEDVDFAKRRVYVRRRLYRGRFDSPKSRYGRRAVPLSKGLTRRLAHARGTRPNEVPVFPSSRGGYLEPSNLMSRVLKPAARKAGVPWAGFHTFRHTCATMLFRHGMNAKQVQVWLGHHSPAFTLATYVHLLPDDLPGADFLDALTGDGGGHKGATRAPENSRDSEAVEDPETTGFPGETRTAEMVVADS
jgi:integrase